MLLSQPDPARGFRLTDALPRVHLISPYIKAAFRLWLTNVILIQQMITMTSFKLLLLSVVLQFVRSDLVPFDDWLYQRVALPDVNIYFRYAGTGPPVLLVHGYPQHSVRSLY